MPTTGTLEVKLGNTIASPGTGSSYIFFRLMGGPWVFLGEPSIDFRDGASLLANYQLPTSVGSFQTFVWDVTAYMPGAFSDLRFRFNGGSAGNSVKVSQAYLQAPDAGSSGSFTITAASGGGGTVHTIDTPLQQQKEWPDYVVIAPSDTDYDPGPHYYSYPSDPMDAYLGGICSRTGMWAPAHDLVLDYDNQRCIRAFASTGPKGTVFRKQR